MTKTVNSRFKDFGNTQTLEDYDPLWFKLNGEEFTCRPAMSGAALLTFISEADSESGAAAKSIVEFLENAIEDGDRDRFTALINDTDRIVEADQLASIARWLIEQYTARPTKGRQRSAAVRSTSGRGSTDTSSEEE